MATLSEAFDDEDVRPIIIFQTDGDEAYFLKNPVIILKVPEGLEGEVLANAQRSVEFHRQRLEENDTQFGLDDLYRAVERSRATVYTVVPGIKLTGLPPEVQFEKFKHDEQARLNELMKRLSGAARDRLKKRLERNDNHSDV